MLSTTIKRTMATALSGAAIAGTIGAPAASAMPIDPVGAPGEPSDVPIVRRPRARARPRPPRRRRMPDSICPRRRSAPRPAPACSSSSSPRAGWRGAGR